MTTPGQARNTITGEQRVAQEPNQLFRDTFDSALDTVNNWNTPTASGTGAIIATEVGGGGAILLTGGTALNAYSQLTSQAKFPAIEPGYMQMAWRVNIENPVLTNSYRFWGLGIVPATPTFAAPITEAVGWEISTAGRLYAVTWTGGVRTQIADLSSSGTNVQPQDSAAHKYYLTFRGDQSYWGLESIDNVCAQYLTGASGPNVNTLNLAVLAVSGGGTAATIQVNGVSLGDTARNNIVPSDGLFPWRKQRVAAQVGTTVSVTSAAADTLLLAANPNRAGAVIANDSTSTLNILLGTTAASATNYTVQLSANTSGVQSYTVPLSWIGMVRGFWAAANGAARVTELT